PRRAAVRDQLLAGLGDRVDGDGGEEREKKDESRKSRHAAIIVAAFLSGCSPARKFDGRAEHTSMRAPAPAYTRRAPTARRSPKRVAIGGANRRGNRDASSATGRFRRVSFDCLHEARATFARRQPLREEFARPISDRARIRLRKEYGPVRE